MAKELSDFGKAFAAARKSRLAGGDDTFEFGGKKYHSYQKGEEKATKYADKTEGAPGLKSSPAPKKNNKWEKIGNTRIDLSDYITKEILQSSINELNTKDDNLAKSISDVKDNITNKENTINTHINEIIEKHKTDIETINHPIS